MTIAITLSFDESMDSSSNSCSNPGVACMGCPNYDHCDQHYDDED